MSDKVPHKHAENSASTKQPHIHAELIKAWADGAEIEWLYRDKWRVATSLLWDRHVQYRIKPEHKPAVVHIAHVKMGGAPSHKPYLVEPEDDTMYPDRYRGKIQLVFDGETGKLKSAEVIPSGDS